MATTSAAIRDAMLELIKGIVPAKHAGQRFLPHREQTPLRDHAAAHPASCLRRVSVRSLMDRAAPAVTTTQIEEVSETFEVVVAYPVDARHGSKAELATDDVIASDQRQIHHVIHVANSPAGATVIRLGDETEDDTQAGVRFAINRYRVDYFWSLT